MSNRLIVIEQQVAEQLSHLTPALSKAEECGMYLATDVLNLVGLSIHPNALARRAVIYPAHFYWAEEGLCMSRLLAQFTLWHFGLMAFQGELKEGGSYE